MAGARRPYPRGYYHQKLRRIKLLTDYCLETITEELKGPGWGPGAGEAGFQRLLPLRRGGFRGVVPPIPSHTIHTHFVLNRAWSKNT